ncbi:ribosomal RNA adenine dimethylase-domain-containing protein [Cyathus striatus]|nr:ribosomal RNA adenine dimethylase-domain-containing protein [Cyathus striatus]
MPPRPSCLSSAFRTLSASHLHPTKTIGNRAYAAAAKTDSAVPDTTSKKVRKRTEKSTKSSSSNKLDALSNNAATKNELPLGNEAELPPIDKWKLHFPATVSGRLRISVHNSDTAAALADAFVPEGSRDKVIIEAFPGPGQLTRALINLPRERVKKIIVLENETSYLKYLRPLEKLDSRVQVIPQGGHEWETYSILDDMGVLSDVERVSWTRGAHPQLTFISHLPRTVYGEQLIAQLFRSIPSRSWLFQFGRIPMHFILTQSVWQRLLTGPGRAITRCKLGIIAQATSELKEAIPFKALQPFNLHFHPRRPSKPATDSTQPNGQPFTTLTAIPLEKQVIRRDQIDIWDYCVRRMLVQKATPLSKSLCLLGPGGQTLLTDYDLSVDPAKHPRELNTEEWTSIVKAFNEWPFAPRDLGIDTMFLGKEHRMTN